LSIHSSFRYFALVLALTFLSCKDALAPFYNEQALFTNGTGGYACYRIPAITTMPDGALVAFVEGRVADCGDFGNVDILMVRSTDQGKTWSSPIKVVDNDTLQVGNPAPVVDIMDPNYPEGRLFLFYNTGTASEYDVRLGKGRRGVFYKTSTDGGHNWSNAQDITSQVHFSLPSSALDWRTNAVTPGHALQFTGDAYKGRIYVPANHSQGPPQDGFNEYRAYGFYSDDHGVSWSVSPDIDVPSSNEAIGVALEDGHLMLNIREQNGATKKRLVAISEDGGASWKDTYFDPALISPVCQSSIIAWPYQQAEVLLYSGPYSTTTRHKMSVLVSFDQGKSWPINKLVYPGTAAYSDLTVLDDSTIGLFYERDQAGLYFARFNFEWLVRDFSSN